MENLHYNVKSFSHSASYKSTLFSSLYNLYPKVTAHVGNVR